MAFSKHPYLAIMVICSVGWLAQAKAELPTAPSVPIIEYISSSRVIITWITKANPKWFVVEYEPRTTTQPWGGALKTKVSRKQRQASLKNLDPNTQYQIRIHAVYDANTKISPTRLFHTKANALEVGVPQGLSLGPLSPYKVRVAWGVPSGFSPQDVVHFHLVYGPLYSPYMEKTSMLLPGNYRSFPLSNLNPGTFYRVKIAAYLKTGRGPYTHWNIVHTLPQSPASSLCTRQPPTTGNPEETGAIEGKATTAPATVTEKWQTTKKVIPKLVSTTERPLLSTPRVEKKRCEKLKPSICSDIGYEHTLMTSNTTQEHVIEHVSSMLAMLKGTCSSHALVKQFLCVTKFPYCDVTLARSFPPCRSMCEAALRRCKPLTGKDSWPPAELKCNQFPIVGDTSMCLAYGVDKNSISTVRPLTLLPTYRRTTSASSGGVTNADAVTTQSSSSSATNQPLSATQEPAARTKSTGSPQLKLHTTGYRKPVETVTGEPTPTKESLTQPGVAMSGRTTSSHTKPVKKPVTAPSGSLVKPVTASKPTTKRAPTKITPVRTLSAVPTNMKKLVDESPTTQKGSLQSTSKSTSPLTTPTAASVPSPVPKSPHCEPLTIGMCQDLGQTHTGFPNYFGNRQQYDAHALLYRFWPLVELKCSPLLKTFLCSLYAPVCNDKTNRGREWSKMPRELLPCRSVCLQVKNRCDLIMGLFGFPWPPNMECDNFPDDTKGERCLYGNDDVTDNGGHNKCFTLTPRHPCSRYYKKATLSINSIHVTQLDQYKSSNIIGKTMQSVSRTASQKCVRNLKLYLCTLYLPNCNEGSDTGTPCRSLCRTTARRCGVTLETLGIQVLGLDKCKTFPRYQCVGKKPKGVSAKGL